MTITLSCQLSRPRLFNSPRVFTGGSVIALLVCLALGLNPLVALSCRIVGRLGVVLFARSKSSGLHLPTDVNRVPAPLRALATGTNRLACHLDEDRIRMDRRKDPHGDPTRL